MDGRQMGGALAVGLHLCLCLACGARGQREPGKTGLPGLQHPASGALPPLTY